jgi:hypothetical protein
MLTFVIVQDSPGPETEAPGVSKRISRAESVHERMQVGHVKWPRDVDAPVVGHGNNLGSRDLDPRSVTLDPLW